MIHPLGEIALLGAKEGWGVVFGERAWCVSVDMGSCSLDSAHETPVGPPPTLLHTEGNPASVSDIFSFGSIFCVTRL